MQPEQIKADNGNKKDSNGNIFFRHCNNKINTCGLQCIDTESVMMLMPLKYERGVFRHNFGLSQTDP